LSGLHGPAFQNNVHCTTKYCPPAVYYLPHNVHCRTHKASVPATAFLSLKSCDCTVYTAVNALAARSSRTCINTSYQHLTTALYSVFGVSLRAGGNLRSFYACSNDATFPSSGGVFGMLLQQHQFLWTFEISRRASTRAVMAVCLCLSLAVMNSSAISQSVSQSVCLSVCLSVFPCSNEQLDSDWEGVHET
jgi:hypothetical protein